MEPTVFGPVFAVIRFNDAADAVRIANDGEYGLGQFGLDRRGLEIARQVRTRTIGINHYQTNFGPRSAA